MPLLAETPPLPAWGQLVLGAWYIRSTSDSPIGPDNVILVQTCVQIQRGSSSPCEEVLSFDCERNAAEGGRPVVLLRDRDKEATEAGASLPAVLNGTHEKTLEFVNAKLERHESNG